MSLSSHYVCSSIPNGRPPKNRLTKADVQREQYQRKRRFTDYVFLRLRDDSNADQQRKPSVSSPPSAQETQRALKECYDRQVPTVRSTLPGDEYVDERQLTIQPRQALHSDALNIHSPKLSGSPSSLPKVPAVADQLLRNARTSAEPRRFHLTKASSTPSLRHMPQKSGIQKRRKQQRKDLAVFVERAEDMIQSKTLAEHFPNVENTSTRQSPHLHPDITVGVNPPRKRPNVSAAEKKWKAETRSKKPSIESTQRDKEQSSQSKQVPLSNWDAISFKLAEEMHHAALVEAQERESTTGSKAEVTPITAVKIKPKPPPLRYCERSAPTKAPDNQHEGMASSDGEDSDYVYDTYIRYFNPTQGSSSDAFDTRNDPLTIIDKANIGILVITEEDEDVWEAYGEDETSDEDLNSEEEDENGTFSCKNEEPLFAAKRK